MVFVHFLTAGTDAADDRWGFKLAIASAVALGVATTIRLLTGKSRPGISTNAAPQLVAVDAFDRVGGRTR
jgi:hypothetical protein